VWHRCDGNVQIHVRTIQILYTRPEVTPWPRFRAGAPMHQPTGDRLHHSSAVGVPGVDDRGNPVGRLELDDLGGETFSSRTSREQLPIVRAG